jgi:hypothetical protein
MEAPGSLMRLNMTSRLEGEELNSSLKALGKETSDFWVQVHRKGKRCDETGGFMSHHLREQLRGYA